MPPGRAIFRDLEAHAALLRLVVIGGLALGLAETALYAIGVAPMALAYAAGFGLLWTRPRWRGWLSLPAPAGRMALTNYLAQSFVGIAGFYGVGLGLGGQVGPALIVPLALLVFGVQVQLSALWLRHCRYGPAEWLWRSLTYGERQPMRLRSTITPATPPDTPLPVATLP